MRETLAQLCLSRHDGIVILVDTTENEEIGCSYILNLVETQVAQLQLITFSRVDISSQRVSPHGHKHSAILLRLGQECIWRMDKRD